MSNKKTYTVLGIYEDNGQRYADTVEAHSPAEAEELVNADSENQVIIAGVIEGDVKVVA